MIARLRAWWLRVRLYEPARFTAAWSAVKLLALELGITVSAGVEWWITAVGAALAILLPLWQGENTRRKVVSETKHKEVVVARRARTSGGIIHGGGGRSII